MSPIEFIHKHIRQMEAYVPGFQPDPEEGPIIKLNTNESPFPPSPKVLEAMEKALRSERLHLYPDPLSRKLRYAIGKEYGLSEKHALIGNGSDEILSLVFRAVLAPYPKGFGLLCVQPSYSLYRVLGQALGLGFGNIREIPLRSDWRINFPALIEELENERERGSKIGLVALANPNAPTGIAEAPKDILAFAAAKPVLTLVDEAYALFCSQSLGPYAGTEEYPRLLVCGTFSKAYSLAGQRIGWLLAHPDIISQIDKVRDSYNVSYLAQVAALAAWEDKKENQKRIEELSKNRSYLVKQLSEMGFQSLDSSANFIFTRPPIEGKGGKKLSAADYSQNLTENKILVRHFPNAERISEYVRISISKKEELEELLSCTRKYLGIQK